MLMDRYLSVCDLKETSHEEQLCSARAVLPGSAWWAASFTHEAARSGPWLLPPTIASPDQSADLDVSLRQGRTRLSAVDNVQAFVRGGSASPYRRRSSVEPVPMARFPPGSFRQLSAF